LVSDEAIYRDRLLNIKHYVIESIQFGILAGRILFKNFQYVGENMSLSILQGHITFRYWLKTVRGHTATTDIDPAINQHGMYNNNLLSSW
jgi:hypothetical protein